MSDNPNQDADDIFNSDHDSDDELVSSADEQSTKAEAQPTEQPPAEPEAEPSEPEPSSEPEANADADEGLDDGRMVSVAALHSERDKRKEEARLRGEAEERAKFYKAQAETFMQQAAQPVQQPVQQQPEPQVELPDIYDDPEGHTRAVAEQVATRVQSQMIDRMVNASQVRANSVYGKQVVDEALDAAHNAGVARQFISEPEPFEALMTWHRRTKAIEEFGDDPAAYKERMEKEVREKVLAELKAGGQVIEHQPNGNGQPVQPAQPQRLPGSLVDAPAQGVQGRQMSQQGLADQLFDSERDRHAP